MCTMLTRHTMSYEMSYTMSYTTSYMMSYTMLLWGKKIMPVGELCRFDGPNKKANIITSTFNP